uniref:Uncharacterized protein n=1 Tax=uncultured Atribacterota bacterium TaxID=263865 RepID=G3BMQ8_9BACT|nr:hypothetical protein [uncultured Atribacterota bacterium]
MILLALAIFPFIFIQLLSQAYFASVLLLITLLAFKNLSILKTTLTYSPLECIFNPFSLIEGKE